MSVWCASINSRFWKKKKKGLTSDERSGGGCLPSALLLIVVEKSRILLLKLEIHEFGDETGIIWLDQLLFGFTPWNSLWPYDDP